MQAKSAVSTLRSLTVIVAAVLLSCGCETGTDNGYPIAPAAPQRVSLQDNFWQPRLEIYRANTLPHILRQCIESGRIENFVIASGKSEGSQHGIYPFDDSDVFKMLEGMSVWLSYHDDPDLDRTLDSLISIIAAAQEPDGYLYTARRNNPPWLERRSGARRWSNLASSHELYNAGHLYLAAAAHFEATGKRSLLDVALRNADLLTNVFGPGGLDLPPGHQVIEMGLTALFRINGDTKYRDLAEFFLARRGRHENRASWGTYAQDHLPVLQQEEAAGHAVRAAYMYAGMLDVAVSTGDREYAQASMRLWENVVGKKMYLTGGLGSVGFGERFSENYDLPNLSAYQETCASIANIMWNHRLFLYTGDGKYFDVLERTLYNALLAGISQNGDRFFYPNPLASRGYHERHPWFPCACCPTNVSRFIPTIPSLFYARKENSIYVNLFGSSRFEFMIGREPVLIEQISHYPWSGNVKLLVRVDKPVRFDLRIRIPGWARNQAVPTDLYRFAETDTVPVHLQINGTEVHDQIHRGYISLDRTWEAGDSVQLVLPMHPRKILAHPAVKTDSGYQAWQCGPLVYCLESPDQAGRHVMPVSVAKDAPLTTYRATDLFGGISMLRSEGLRSRFYRDSLYTEPVEVNAIPYFLWANRGLAEMTVWIPSDPSLSEPLDKVSFSQMARVSGSGGVSLSAVNDLQFGPEKAPVFLWPEPQDTVWIRYDFPDEEEFSATGVYWYTSDSKPPNDWKILALVEGKWHAVYNYLKPWGTEPGMMNRVLFETVRTRSLRLEVRKEPGQQCGVIEWEVD